MRAFVVAALVNCDFFLLFPGIKWFRAIRTKVFYFIVKPFMKLKDFGANFAFQLRSFFAIVEINILMGCRTGRTFCRSWDKVFRIPDIDRFE